MALFQYPAPPYAGEGYIGFGPLGCPVPINDPEFQDWINDGGIAGAYCLIKCRSGFCFIVFNN